jgi:hypothetical protein
LVTASRKVFKDGEHNPVWNASKGDESGRKIIIGVGVKEAGT